jgi:hypothetical protein
MTKYIKGETIMKKHAKIILALLLAISALSVLALAGDGEKIAVQSQTKLFLDGKETSLSSAYVIDESNYIQLKSVAQMLNNTKSQFNVYWDEAQKIAVIETGKPYSGQKSPVEPSPENAYISMQDMLAELEAAEAQKRYNQKPYTYAEVLSALERMNDAWKVVDEFPQIQFTFLSEPRMVLPKVYESEKAAQDYIAEVKKNEHPSTVNSLKFCVYKNIVIGPVGDWEGDYPQRLIDYLKKELG